MTEALPTPHRRVLRKRIGEARRELTHEWLRQLIDYDPETGLFMRRVQTMTSKVGVPFAGTMMGKGKRRHRVFHVDGKLYYAHRIAWFWMTGEWPPSEIDHIDNDGGNNRWENLRLATKSQNGANRSKDRDNSTGYKGVSFNRRTGKYDAYIGVEGRHIYLGQSDSAEDAHALYDAGAKRYFGEYGRAV